MEASPSGPSLLVGWVDAMRGWDTSVGGCAKTSAALLSRERSLVGTRGIDAVHGGRVRRGQYRRPKCPGYEIRAHIPGDIDDYRCAHGRDNGGCATPRHRADSAHANGKLTSRGCTPLSRVVHQILARLLGHRYAVHHLGAIVGNQQRAV